MQYSKFRRHVMDIDLNQKTEVERYLDVSHELIQHKTNIRLHSSMFYKVAKIESGYQITAMAHHIAPEEAPIKIAFSEAEFKQLLEKSKIHFQAKQKHFETMRRVEQERQSELEEMFKTRLTLLTKFQSAQVNSDEESKQKFKQLMTTYPIASEILKALNPISFYADCTVSYENKGSYYHIKAIDYRHNEHVAADFEISKKQLNALAKLEAIGITHKSWVIENNLCFPAMRDGSLYIKFVSLSDVKEVISVLNAAYGEGTCRNTGAGAEYLKINCTTPGGKKAIEEILVALNMPEVPKYIPGMLKLA